jgi:hypothetical protein
VANLLKSIGGLAIASLMGKSDRAKALEKTNAMNKKLGMAEVEQAPIDKAFDWATNKFKDWQAAPSVPSGTPATETAFTPVQSGDDVGLWERIKAGNIDAPGSEAHNRWGNGKAEGEARATDLAESSRLEAEQNYSDEPVSTPNEVAPEFQNAAKEGVSFDAHDAAQSGYTKQMFDDAPSANMVNEEVMDRALSA